MRGRSPWLWPDIIYNLSSPGREFNRCLKILHDFTDKVYSIRLFMKTGMHGWHNDNPAKYFIFTLNMPRLCRTLYQPLPSVMQSVSFVAFFCTQKVLNIRLLFSTVLQSNRYKADKGVN